MKILKPQDHMIEVPYHRKALVPNLKRLSGFNDGVTSNIEHGSFFSAAKENLLESNLNYDPSFLKATGVHKSRRRKWEAWQKLVALNCVLIILVFICNSGIMIWSIYRPEGSYGLTRLLYEGDCGRTKSIDFWSHMAINIFSTIILAGGNYAGQILVAPTRDAVDKAHRQGRSLDIGVQSFRNWPFLGRRPKILVSILFITTVPLHVIYNSTIYSTSSAAAVIAALVTNDFLTVPQASFQPHTISPYSIETSITGFSAELSSRLDNSTLQALFDQAREGSSDGYAAGFDNLTLSNCWSTFSATFVHDYSAVLYFTDIPSSTYNASILAPGFANFGLVASNNIFSQSMPVPWKGSIKISNGTSTEVNMVYCLALKIEAFCTIELVPIFLVIVIACNLIKVLVLLHLLYLRIHPLKTMGDAIACFIEFPDSVTEGLCVVGVDIVKDSRKRRRYFSGASATRWRLATVLCVLYWIFGLVWIVFAYVAYPRDRKNISLSQQWKDGFGALELQAIIPFNTDFLPEVVIVNLPQLFLSFAYIFYNALLTDLLLSREGLSYSFERKGLRVTNPIGEQRSTYFLSLPYRFSIPLAGLMAMLHWMLSQSLFLGEVNTYSLRLADDYSSGPLLNIRKSGRGGAHVMAYSTLGMMMSLVIGGILIIAIVALGFCKYKPGISLVWSDSRVISAACHPMERYRDSTKKVQHGILADLGDGTYHVSFSSGPVMTLVDGDNHQQ